MTSKRILALSITSAMVLAACQQPAPAPVVTSPTVTNVVANPNTVTQGSNVSTTVTFSTTNGGGTISSARANLAGSDTTCNLVSGSTSNYTCNVPVPSSVGTGSKNITVTVTNNAPTNNTVTGNTTVTVNAAPVANVGAPTITGSVTGSVAQGGVAAISYTATAGTNGTIQQITASIGGTTAVCGTNLTGVCNITIPSNTPAGAANIVLTVTNNGAAGSNTASVNVPVTVTAVAPPVTPPGTQEGPRIDNIAVAPITLNTGATGTASVLVDADAQDGTTLKSLKISYNGVVVDERTLAPNTTGINQFILFPVSGTDLNGPVSVEVVDSNNRVATASRTLEITRNVVVTPPTATAIFGAPAVAGTGIRTDDIDDNTQFRARFLDQVDPSNAAATTTRLYIRGTFEVATLPTLVGTRGGAGLTSATWAAGPSIEYFLSNTTTDAGNKLGAKLNTVGLNNGQIYYIYARRSGPGGDGSSAGVFTFVPDNLEPQVPDISDVSDIPNLRNQLGNWVTFNPLAGKSVLFPVGSTPTTATGRTLELRLDNARSLEDRPQDPTGGNPGAAVRGTGIREVRYFAQPVSPTYVGGPITTNAALDSAIPLGVATNNGVGFNNGQDNYKVDVTSIPQGLLKDGRYVVVAVAYDYLGNRNMLGGQNSFILNVDSVGPTSNLGIRDRGPLDVNADFVATGTTPLACRRVDVFANPQNAPTDVYTAQLPTLADPTIYISGCAVVNGGATDTAGSGATPVGFGLSPFAIGVSNAQQILSLNPLLLNNTTLGGTTATLLDTVINVNQASGLIDFNVLPRDILGNPGVGTTQRVIVDNEEPVQLALNLATTNSSNVFNAWQQVGLQGTAFDGISGLRTVNPFAYYYGTDADSTAPTGVTVSDNRLDSTAVLSVPSRGIYNRTLVQIDQSNVSNFNIPSPTNSNINTTDFDIDRQNLNVWLVAADKAGNANGQATVLKVGPVNPNLPTVVADAQGNTTDGVLPDFENGTPTAPYKGLTALNRAVTGVVPALTVDQLPVGPVRLNDRFSEGPTVRQPTPPAPAPLGVVPNSYSRLPTPGNNNTNVYELIVPASDITFRGNTSFTQGAGLVDFVYRVADPLATAPTYNSTAFVDVLETNPSDLANSTVAPIATRFLYNLPAWSTRVSNVRQVGHIWDSLPDQGVENGVYKAVLDPSLLPVFDTTGGIGHNGVGVMVFNNYGNVNIQTKGVTSGNGDVR